MDILLTSEEITAIERDSIPKWYQKYPIATERREHLWRESRDEEVCRAQVRNVAKWMEQEGVVVHERQLGFVLPFQSWAALKAAGGEG